MTEDFAHAILSRLEQIQARGSSHCPDWTKRRDGFSGGFEIPEDKTRNSPRLDSIWIRLRRIPFHRAGRRILFRARDLDAWLEARKIAHRLSKRELRAAS